MHYGLRFALAVFAVWRVTHLLSREDGPWDVFRRLRRTVILSRVLVCFYCLSVWVALPFAFFLKGNLVETAVGWLAASGAAILLERMTRDRVELKVEDVDRWDVVVKR
jgi:hypothetical protein